MKKVLLLLLLIQYSLSAQEYTVQSIGFTPPNSFLDANIIVDTDDDFTNVIPLGFNFHYYENVYSELKASGNGVLNFNTLDGLTFQQWVISEEFYLPDDSEPSVLNSIMLWHDMNVNSNIALSTTLIGFSTIGVAPNRRFVANYNDAPHFGSEVGYSTFQIVLYETSNIIEFYIKEKQFTDWNDGRSVLGIQNADGTSGLAAPDRNNRVWDAHNEAWRFVPYNADYIEAFPANITICNNGEDSAVFNLTIVNDIVSGYRADTSVTYHFSEEDALANINIIDPVAFESSEVILHARVMDISTGLIDVSTVGLYIVLCNGDSDNDGVTNSDENLNQNGNLTDDDTDNDGIPNYMDSDDDNDSIPTMYEIGSPDQRTHTVIDTDNDGIENYLDNNDDDDALLTIDEDYNQDGNFWNDDLNNNGIPDYLDEEVESLAVEQFNLNLDKITIYPNPARDILNFKTPNSLDIKSISIYNTLGKRVKYFSNFKGNTSIKITELPIGHYVFHVETSKGIQTITFLKK